MPIAVQEVMGRVAVAVHMNARFTDIVAVMKRYAVGAVTVIDEDRRPVGVVSQDDLLLRETDPVRHSSTIYETSQQRDEHRKAAGRIAADLMSTPAITVTPETSVREAARIMHERRINQLPVVHATTGRIVGTVYRTDLLRIFDRPVEELRRDVEAAIQQIAGPDAMPKIEIEDGVVRLSGRVERESQAIQIAEAARRVEGVIDVEPDLTFTRSDLASVPPPR